MAMKENRADVVWEGGLQDGKGRLKVASQAFSELTVTFSARTEGAEPLRRSAPAARTDTDAELGFELLEVLVVGAEQRFGPLVRDLNLAYRGGWQVTVAILAWPVAPWFRHR